MWWLADPHDLHRVSDRVSTVYVERSHVDRAENAVVLVNRERSVRVPAAFIATLLLGPGTRVTHAAMRLLADSGTAVAWVGEHGVRMYASGLGPSRSSRVIERQAYLVSRPEERIKVARVMYGMRFPGESVDSSSMQQLRGREGVRVRKLYRHHSERTGVPWKKRDYKPGDAFAAGDDVNRVLSAANACLYAACHAAIVGIGASPALGFVHTGSALSFVLDIADLYKAEYTIPLAFNLAAAGRVDETDARYELRDRFKDGQFLQRVVADVKELILSGEPDDEQERNRLWDDLRGSVASGTNYSVDAAEELEARGYLDISGPEVNTDPDPNW